MLVVVLSLLGGIVKILGGLLYGSKALFVDAMTCIANFVALTATIYYYKASLIPPDEDHHFGHHRLGYGGAIVSLLAYSFVAGIVVFDLLATREYNVEIYAPLFATIGFLLYFCVIFLSRKISSFFGPYSVFTVSELIESTTVIIASLAGALYSYLIDFGGAIILTTYLFYEIYGVTKDLLYHLSDIAPSKTLLDDIKKTIESYNVRLKKLRVRMVSPGVYYGEATIQVPRDLTVDKLEELITMITRKVKEEHRVELLVTIETRK